MPHHRKTSHNPHTSPDPPQTIYPHLPPHTSRHNPTQTPKTPITPHNPNPTTPHIRPTRPHNHPTSPLQPTHNPAPLPQILTIY